MQVYQQVYSRWIRRQHQLRPSCRLRRRRLTPMKSKTASLATTSSLFRPFNVNASVPLMCWRKMYKLCIPWFVMNLSIPCTATPIAASFHHPTLFQVAILPIRPCCGFRVAEHGTKAILFSASSCQSSILPPAGQVGTKMRCGSRKNPNACGWASSAPLSATLKASCWSPTTSLATSFPSWESWPALLPWRCLGIK